MTIKASRALAAATFAVLTLSAASASADTLVGLVGDKTLALIDPTNQTVTKTVEVTGTDGLIGIDVRPADGMLYGVTAAGAVVTIDPMTGAATQKSMLSEKLAAGTMATVDFNPVADRLRVMASDGTSLRVNVDDGKVTKDGSHKYAEADAMKGMTPKVSAGAYTNSLKGTKTTALFNVDAAHGTLVAQNPPNDGVLNTVGKLGVPVDGRVAFNIVSTGEGENAAWLLAGGKLYKVDLKSGKASEAGMVAGINGDVSDMAWLPTAM